jgi:hypothetical protein
MSKLAIKAIRKKCLWCSNNQIKEITFCTIPDCPLYPYRFGKDPFSKKKGNVANLRPYQKAS